VAGGGGGTYYRRRSTPAAGLDTRPPLVPLQAKMKEGFYPEATSCGFHLSLKREMNYPTNLRVRRAWEGVKELRHKRFGTDSHHRGPLQFHQTSDHHHPQRYSDFYVLAIE
jgi:hypothetical protein